MSRPIVIIGAGGHATVVADALLACGLIVLGFTDSDPALADHRACGLRILGNDNILASYATDEIELVIGLGGAGAAGSLALRERVQQRLAAGGWRIVGVRHPSAIVSVFAEVADSAQLFAGAIVQPHARIADGAIVNTGAIAEHDSVVGAFSHVASAACVCGGVTLGVRVHVGASAVVRQGVRVADDVVIGAGASVVRDCPISGAILIGIPAQVPGAAA